MPIARSIVILVVASVVSTAVVCAQSPASAQTVAVPIKGTSTESTWPGKQPEGSSNDKVLVVTFDRPDQKQHCHIESVTADRLVCSRALGRTRTFLREDVVALISPGDTGSKLPIVLGFNVGLGAAIWGTVVLAATCPPCAVATGIVAFAFFGGAGAVLIGDDQPDRLMYLAPGQQLSRKLGFVER